MDDKQTRQIKCYVSETEYKRIQDNAKAMDRTVSAYIRESAKNACVIAWDYQQIIDHTHEITSLRNAINQLIYTIRRTGEYVPADLEYILEKMNEISKSENEFLGLMLEDTERKTRVVAQTVRKIIREKLKKATEQK